MAPLQPQNEAQRTAVALATLTPLPTREPGLAIPMRFARGTQCLWDEQQKVSDVGR